MKSNYVPLFELVEDWSTQSGELKNHILTNLCDFEATGLISSEAFKYPYSDGYIRQGILTELVGQMYNSGYKLVRNDAVNCLEMISVSKSHILLLCRTYEIRPPRCVIGMWRWFLWRSYKHEAIPSHSAVPLPWVGHETYEAAEILRDKVPTEETKTKEKSSEIAPQTRAGWL